MKKTKFFVLDTNVLISAALIKTSVNALAYDRALTIGRIAISNAIIEEFAEVLLCEKFDRYFKSAKERIEPILRLQKIAHLFVPTEIVTASADPDDNRVGTGN